MNEPSINTIAVIGLGKLGSPIAACLATRGFNVIGTDKDAATVEIMRRGKAPVEETGLQQLLDMVTDGSLTTAQTTAEAVRDSDACFVVVPTPSTPAEPYFDNFYVLAALEDVGEALRDMDGYYLVTVVSTVMPNSMATFKALLEGVSGRKCGPHFGLCYSPEFIALGSVIKDYLRPDLVLIGESDPHAGTYLEYVYRKATLNDPPIVRTSFVNAEIAKLALNCYVTLKITYANFLADLCETLPGGDADEVARALGHDSRIGPKFLKGATAFGGPCFPRDVRALAELVFDLGLDTVLPRVVHELNKDRTIRLANLVRRHAGPETPVAILGLAYKPGTSLTEESPGLALMDNLLGTHEYVLGCDPMRPESVPLVDCVRLADVVVIVQPCREYKDLRFRAGQTVIDCWRVLEDVPDNINYVAIGRSVDA
jgi:UDPglucose 6-dehydrogenase